MTAKIRMPHYTLHTYMKVYQRFKSESNQWRFEKINNPYSLNKLTLVYNSLTGIYLRMWEFGKISIETEAVSFTSPILCACVQELINILAYTWINAR